MAVAFDAVGPSSAGTGSGTSPLSWAHTTVAAGCAMLVGVAEGHAAGADGTVTATCDGTSMTLLASRTNNNQNGGRTILFGIANLASGSHTISVSRSGGAALTTLVGGSVSYSGVSGVTPFGTPVTNFGNSAGPTVTVTGTTAGNMAGGCESIGSSTTTTESGGTLRWKNDFDGTSAAGNAAQGDIAAGGSVTLTWASGSADWWGAIGVEILAGSPVPPSGPGTSSLIPVAPGLRHPASFRHPAAARARLPRDQTITVGVAHAGAAAVSAVATQTGPPFIAGIAGSGSGQYFTDQFSRPILYLQDVPWGLPGNAGRWNGGDWQADISAYLTSRAAQKFTCIRVHIFGTTKTGAPNDNGNTWDGIAPFVSGNPGSLNNTYWQRIDYLVDTALGKGITVEMTATFDWDFRGTVFASGWTSTDAQNFGTALGGRYASRPNVLWFFGDDYFGDRDSIYNAVIAGIRNAGDSHPATIENYSTGTTSRRDLSGSPSGTAFSWGGTYATYNLVYYYWVTYFGIEFAYQETSPVLVIWGDGYYYGDAAAGATNDRVERQMAWWALASGARGVSTGSDAIWQWPSTAPAAVTTENWYTTVAPAIRTYFEGLTDWHKLAPDTGNVFVTAGRGTRAAYNSNFFGGSDTDNYVAASITAAGTLAVIYCASSMSITIDQAKMNAGYTATWVDPASLATTGTATGSTYSSSGLGNNSAGGPDWVLVLQAPAAANAAAGVAAPSVVAPAASTAVTASAGVATVSAVAAASTVAETASAGVAIVAAVAVQPAVSTSGTTNAPAGVAAVTVTAVNPVAAVTATAAAAAAAATGAAATGAAGANAAAAAAAPVATTAQAQATATAGAAAAAAAANNATVSTSSQVNAPAGVAAAAATAPQPVAAGTATAGVAASVAAAAAAVRLISAGAAASTAAATTTAKAVAVQAAAAAALTQAAQAAGQGVVPASFGISFATGALLTAVTASGASEHTAAVSGQAATTSTAGGQP